MSTDLKVYTEQTVVKLFDGTTIITTASLDKLLDVCNSGTKFIKLGGQLVNTASISYADSQKIGEIESFILQLPKDTQQRVRERDKQKFERVGKHFETVEEIQNYIQNNNL